MTKENKNMRSVIHIEICKGSKDMYNMRIGDIEGCSESHNIDEIDIIKEITEKLDELGGKK